MACLTIKEKTANFTHNVKWLREHYGYSKTRMAKILKISTASLERIESGCGRGSPAKKSTPAKTPCNGDEKMVL